MTGDESDIIAQGPQAIANGCDELGMIATWQVSTANRASKQHIADQGQLVATMKKHHMT